MAIDAREVSSNESKAEFKRKINMALVEYVYQQATIGLVATVCCITVLLVGLYTAGESSALVSWYSVFLGVVLVRYV